MPEITFSPINEEALSAWYEAEWDRQSENLNVAVKAFDVLAVSKKYGVVDTSDYEKITDLISQLNGKLSLYTRTVVKMPDEIISIEQLRKAHEIFESLDEIERAGYNRVSMAILLSEGGYIRVSSLSMLSFVVTNHLYQKFGASVLYPRWLNPVADLGWNCGDMDRIKTAIYRHCRFMLSIRYCHMTDPITGNKIQPPEEFYLE